MALVQSLVQIVVIAVLVACLTPFLSRLLSRGSLEGAVRTPGGRSQHGRLQVRPGVIDLTPYRWQIRVLTGPGRTLRVTGCADWVGRSPSFRQLGSLNSRVRIVCLDTTAGEVELAALPPALAKVQQGLRVTG